MENKIDIMLDIETLGTDPGAAIISIGAVAFQLETGKIIDELDLHIDLKSAMDYGLKIDPQTLQWWLSQEAEAVSRALTPKSPVTLPQALLDLEDFISKWWRLKYVEKKKDVLVWGNSARFDCGLLQHAFTLVYPGKELPWAYSSERDVRTLVAFAPDLKGKVVQEWKDKGEVLHDALVDCKMQIDYCSRIFNQLNLKINA